MNLQRFDPSARGLGHNIGLGYWCHMCQFRISNTWPRPIADGSKRCTFHKDVLQTKLISYNMEPW